MMRAYAIGIGAGTQVLTNLPWFILFGKPGEFSRALLMGAGWGINLLVAEWIIRRGRAQRRAPVMTPPPVAIPAGATGVPSLEPRHPASESGPPALR